LVKSLVFSCTHIFREGNQVPNVLAQNGQGLTSFASQWWDSRPGFLAQRLDRDRICHS